MGYLDTSTRALMAIGRLLGCILKKGAAKAKTVEEKGSEKCHPHGATRQQRAQVHPQHTLHLRLRAREKEM